MGKVVVNEAVNLYFFYLTAHFAHAGCSGCIPGTWLKINFRVFGSVWLGATKETRKNPFSATQQSGRNKRPGTVKAQGKELSSLCGYIWNYKTSIYEIRI